jgi:GAF domain-containing protein
MSSVPWPAGDSGREPSPQRDIVADQRFIGAPTDPDVANGIARLQQLGVQLRPDPEFDRLARELAEELGVPDGLAMVNFIEHDTQYFAGLYAKDPSVSREMSREDGWCPHTVLRKKPLPLRDVGAWARFETNRVADELGIQSYLGAPLIGPDGTLGTICLIDSETHQEWRSDHVEVIAAKARQVVELIYRRAGTTDTPAE